MVLFSHQKSLKRTVTALLAILFVCRIASFFCDWLMSDHSHTTLPFSSHRHDHHTTTMTACCEYQLEQANSKTILSSTIFFQKLVPFLILVLFISRWIALLRTPFSSKSSSFLFLLTPFSQKVLLRI